MVHMFVGGNMLCGLLLRGPIAYGEVFVISLLYRQRKVFDHKSLLKGAYFKDERSLGGRGGRPNAVSISNNDVIV